MSAAMSGTLLALSLAACAALCSGAMLKLLLMVPAGTGTPAGVEPQRIHEGPTTRLGGLAVLVGFVVADGVAVHLDPAAMLGLVPLSTAALPVVWMGLWEDVARSTSPMQRLVAAIASAALASAFAGGIVTRVDLPFLDAALAYVPLAVAISWFMVAGACNAFNIIDGVNGLAGGTALIAFVGMALVAWQVGDHAVLGQAAALAGALLGFLVWNYPRGRVFLGDGGAYFTGFMY
ncbi:MAG TPA: glycosyltransferase, partial [Casimicrobiaceae bacterium]|nr:glycosyltransferase [Casimicrobiaceae bacterium]